jgi:ABC-2 type transport system permease protein
VVLLVVAVLLRGTRDTGGALLASDDTRDPHLHGLAGQAAFAWRSNQAVLLAWVVGLAAYGFILGALLNSSIDFIESDADYRRILERMGLDVALTAEGFLGFMSSTLGVAFAMYAAWRVGAVRNEEESGRADNLLTRALTRTRWLVTHTLLAVVSSALLAVMTGIALWAGAVTSGAQDVSLLDCLRSVGNTGSVVVLVIGVAVLTLGLAPRLTVAVAAAVSVGGYVLALLGPPLSWPDWVVDLSPFSHLAFVPAEPFAGRAAAVLALLGIAAAAAGVAAFEHRDLQGA